MKTFIGNDDMVLCSVRAFIEDEEGATAIEYALLAALLGATIVGAQTALGNTVMSMYQNAANTIMAAMGS